MPEENLIAAAIIARLAPHLGPHVARMAMKTFCQKALGATPETTAMGDVPRLLEAMQPMLNVMLGSDRAQAVLAEIGRDLLSPR